MRHTWLALAVYLVACSGSSGPAGPPEQPDLSCAPSESVTRQSDGDWRVTLHGLFSVREERLNEETGELETVTVQQCMTLVCDGMDGDLTEEDAVNACKDLALQTGKKPLFSR